MEAIGPFGQVKQQGSLKALIADFTNIGLRASL